MKEEYPQPHCIRCGTALILVPETSSWYCNNCKTYPELSKLTTKIGTPEGAQQFAMRWILLIMFVIFIVIMTSIPWWIF